MKTLLLTAYYYASRPLRWWQQRSAVAEGRVPVTILCYHRIADDRATPWTMSNRTFAEHVRWLGTHFDLISLEEAQRRIRRGANDRPSVSITFDDGYADNCQEAIPLLIKERVPCTYFVTTRSVLEGEIFAHDRAAGLRLAPNTLEQVRAMAAAGVEIGAHCYTHPDLASITDRRRLHYEVVTAGEDLQAAIGRPVRYFAFPFGQHANLSRDVFELAYQVGYEGVCSCYGGFNYPGDDAFHLQRIPVGDTIRMKNWVTIDPRKHCTPRFQYETKPVAADPRSPAPDPQSLTPDP